ncbi:MAG: hypothetical protein HC804_14010, partial [Anaerolineae bacterium]|nr:hypothetical protein [Anaerolineae bacterium]
PYQLILIAQRLLAEMEAHMEQDEQEVVALVLAQAEKELATAVLTTARTEAEKMTLPEMIERLVGRG